ncbi:transglutaminase domain-containing protein [Flavobacterium sp. MC2016-06]|uniref:transglutaminase domain-containing protein n=1 Tax=Flavobacterium sp. MC2016-06 TaxID=2676308 RepID=UPI0012BA7C08|nr:transglutaminase domain-containing protein [Flavobacterium sp. MC2016-06]MBU3859771.1 transglutaminase [Flavobacterium sp. MC2016-06]
MPLQKLIFTFLFLNVIFLCPSFAQNYNKVDKIVLKYPKQFNSTEELAERIQEDFSSEEDKARAIYSWIAFNIDYDYAAFLNPQKAKGFSYRSEAEKERKIQQFNNEILQKAFKSQKAVCEGFTLLYSHLAGLVGLKTQVIRGDSKTRLSDIGRENILINHAWNMVLIDEKWRLIDVTWGEGYYNENKRAAVKDFTSIYFDADPAFFFAKHYPESGTFLGEKLSKEDFLNGPLIYNKLIENNSEIIAPNSGLLEVKNGDKVTFRIKNISKTDQVYYLNKRNQPVKIENPKEKRGSLEFQVTIDKNTGSFITFYLYTNSIVSFKVIPK